MGSFEELQALMLKYRFRPEKKHSQYFCINEALLKFMVMRAKLSSSDVVLEVGPGAGFLTKFLLEKCKVVAVDIDESMIEVLMSEFKKEISEKKLKLIHGDVLEQDFNELGITKIVSLPPYHISTALVTKIISSGIKKSIIVLDRGFVQKLTAFEGLSEYGWLSVFANANTKIEILEENIEASSFFPNPNCLSALVEMDFKELDNSDEFLFFLKELFRHKNKDLSRALKQAYPFLENKLKIKGLEKKIGSIKTREKKLYLHTPQEMEKIFKILIKK